MDHEEAVRLQAAVKYVLGELPQAERDSFEEHYFDCAKCALDVRAAAAFTDNARNMLCQEAREAASQAAAPAGGKWLAWLTQVVEVNPGSRAGAYQLVVFGSTGPESEPAKATVLAEVKFSVEFSH